MQDFLQKFEERRRRFIPCGGNKAILKEGDIFGKKGDIGVIILGDNPTGHCILY